MTLLELILRKKPSNIQQAKGGAPPASAHQYWRQRRRARLGYEMPEYELESKNWFRRIRLPLPPAKKHRQLSDLARFRGDTWVDTPQKKYVLARLSIPGNRPIYGVSAHGQKTHLRAPISRTHAEGDAFNQALRKKGNSTYGQLVVDRPFCKSCGQMGGVMSMARQAGLRVLDVVQPHLPYRERFYLRPGPWTPGEMRKAKKP